MGSLNNNAHATAAARTVLANATVAAMVDTLGGVASTGTGGLVRETSPTFNTEIFTPVIRTLAGALTISPAQNQSAVIALSNGGVFLVQNGPIRTNTTIQPGGYTVNTLPVGTIGAKCYVTDALAPSNLVLLAAGGAAYSGAQFNGTQWVGD